MANKKTYFAHKQKRFPFNIERPSRPSVSVLSAQSRIRRESLTVFGYCCFVAKY
jgi:hypothetical protein